MFHWFLINSNLYLNPIEKSMRKSFLFVIVSCFFFINAKSQITQGNWMVGGSIGFSSTAYNSDAGGQNSGFNLNIAPDIGYFITDKFVSGIRVGFNKQGSKSTSSVIGTSVYNSYTDANFGAFLRYYFLDTEKQFNLLVDGAYQYGFVASSPSNQSNNKHTFSINAGPVVYFNSSVGLEFLIGYTSQEYVGFKGNNNTVQVSLGLHFHLEK